MALEVYFRDDIAQGLQAVTVAILSSAEAHGRTNLEYIRGALDLARAQALNYGIPWASLVRDISVSLSGDVRVLLGECVTAEG